MINEFLKKIIPFEENYNMTECLRVGQSAPDFTATAVVDQEFKTLKLSDYRGKYVVLFF